jgi:hypothetical protein
MIFGTLFTACTEFFSVNPDDVLLEENYPNTVTELYSGYMGIASTIQEVADKGSFLEGLRGDFLEPTMNASKDIVELYNYNVSADNELADPVGYYKIILNANDYINHAAKFIKENPTSIDEQTFDALVGGAIRYKCWAYIQLAKIYGKAVWIDDPLAAYSDISAYPVYEFASLIDKCIELMEKGIVINGENIPSDGNIRWSEVLFPGQGESSSNLQWNRICPPAECLLAELYLFSGNYQGVVDNVLSILREGGLEASFQLNKSEWNGEWMKPFGGFYRKESIFMFTYDYNLNQTNRLIDYYSNLPPNQYLMRPTQAAMDRFNIQISSDGSIGDANRGEGKTFKKSNGEWVVNKFSAAHETADKIYRNDVLITLYRASDIHLWLAEALNNLGRFEEALIFLNGGIETYYNSSSGVFIEPFENYPVSLYRTSSSGDGASQGVRGRVSLNKVGEQILKNPSDDIDKDKFVLDSLIIEETCLESAGEARALYAMIRVAKRWNDPSVVADRVSAKYPDGKAEGIKTKLMIPENWFINFPLEISD